jgi:hypothetical protein
MEQELDLESGLKKLKDELEKAMANEEIEKMKALIDFFKSVPEKDIKRIFQPAIKEFDDLVEYLAEDFAKTKSISLDNTRNFIELIDLWNPPYAQKQRIVSIYLHRINNYVREKTLVNPEIVQILILLRPHLLQIK